LVDILVNKQVYYLIALALAARPKAHAPYSKFAIKAAIKCKSGQSFLAVASKIGRLLG
jgi:cytidine deaminase